MLHRYLLYVFDAFEVDAFETSDFGIKCGLHEHAKSGYTQVVPDVPSKADISCAILCGQDSHLAFSPLFPDMCMYAAKLMAVKTVCQQMMKSALDESCTWLQKVELRADKILWLGKCDNSRGKYPLSKKGQSMESLRDRLHLRPRTNIIGAVARIRNALAHATHTFFQSRGFLYVHTPLITTSDCEGAGEMFQV